MKKRIFLSVVLSLVFIGLLISIPYILLSRQMIGSQTSYLLALPVRFPFIVYTNLLGFGVPKQDLTGILILFGFILFDLIFYALIFFGILSLIANFRREKTAESADVPPEPPVFG
jgi:hypothetical protein